MPVSSPETAAQLWALVAQFRTQFALSESPLTDRVPIPFPDTQPFLSLDDLAYFFEEVLALFSWQREQLE